MSITSAARAGSHFPRPTARPWRSLGALAVVAASLAIGTACGDDLGSGSTVGFDGDEDGFSDNDGDCNDEDPAVYPGAEDFFGDGVDQDCSGTDGVDLDRDGHPDRAFGGDDCDDSNAGVNPDEVEIGWDDIDQDCDGTDLRDYVAIDAGEFHTCAIATTGKILCWGDDAFDQLRAPVEGSYTELQQGLDFGCAVDDAMGVTCWGDDTWGQVSDAPTSGQWEKLAVGYQTACAIDFTTKFLTCWGKDRDPVTTGEFDPFPGLLEAAVTNVRMTGVALGEEHACAIQELNLALTCWGNNKDYQATPPFFNEGWKQISAGEEFACAIGDLQQMKCWGDNNYDQTQPENDPGPYTHLASFYRHSCAIESNVDVACWGLDTDAQVSGRPTEGTWRQVAVGKEHSCALSDLGEVTCWGSNAKGQLEVP